MIRKENKLPGDVVLSDSYFLPYKKINNKLEMQKDLDLKDKTILLFDEAIDTGATLKTAIDLIKKFEPEKIIILTISNFPNIKSFNDIEVLSLVYGPY